MLAMQYGEMFGDGFFAQRVMFGDIGNAAGTLLDEGVKDAVARGVVQ